MKPAFAPASGFDSLSPRRPLPVARPRPRVARAAPARGRASTLLAALALATAVLLELGLQRDAGFQFAAWQAGAAFKQLSGYTMVTLMSLAMLLGRLRKVPLLASHPQALNAAHQASGWLLLVLLAAHVGPRPSGFLLLVFHAVAYATAAGAARALLAARLGRESSLALLAVHISLSCLVAAAALVHLYLVYAYTA